MKLKLYEDFHKMAKFLVRVPNEDDYTYKPIFDFFKENILNNIKEKACVLDMGCGVGSIAFFLERKGCIVDGVDISSRAINLCRKTKKINNIKNAHFICSDLNNLNLKRKYDLVVLSEVIEHIKDDEKQLLQVYKYLKKDSLLFISTPSVNSPLYRLGLLKKFDERVGHLRRYLLLDIKKLLRKTGFKIVLVRKNEGILRNFLFTFKIGGLVLKVINRSKFLSNLFRLIDNKLLLFFGESDYFVLARRI